MAIFNSYVSLPEGKALDLRYSCVAFHGFSSYGGETRYNHHRLRPQTQVLSWWKHTVLRRFRIHPPMSIHVFFHGFNSDIHVFFMVWCLYGLISLIPISPISKVFRWFLISISNMAKRFGQLLCFPSSIPTTTHRVCSGSQGHRSAIAGETSGKGW